MTGVRPSLQWGPVAGFESNVHWAQRNQLVITHMADIWRHFPDDNHVRTEAGSPLSPYVSMRPNGGCGVLSPPENEHLWD